MNKKVQINKHTKALTLRLGFSSLKHTLKDFRIKTVVRHSFSRILIQNAHIYISLRRQLISPSFSPSPCEHVLDKTISV